MTVRRRSMVLLVLPAVFSLVPLLGARVALADGPPPLPEAKQAGIAPQFMRLVDDGAAGGRLETADVTYKRDDGARVTLVSAVHIGEHAYFDGLNDSFKKYDAVLFELIKPKGGGLPGIAAAGGEGAQQREPSAIGQFQHLMKDALNLSFQLDVVDYTAKNFVHADLDAESFEKFQRDKGQTFPELFMKAMMRAMSEPGKEQKDLLGNQDPEEMIHALIRTYTRPDSERQLKLMLARQMTSVEQDTAMFGGDDSVIVHDRNAAAMKVLETTLKDPSNKQVAIYYGAAHMPDMEKRLTAMGFTKTATEWRTAWDLHIRADQPSAVEQFLEGAVEELFKGLDDTDQPAEESGEPVVVR